MNAVSEKKRGVLKADLHCHSREDPRDNIPYTEKELIDTAADLGYDVLSITNHDRLTFTPELEAYARQRGILLIPGIELTVGRKHVLLLNYRDGKHKIKRLEDLALLDDEVAIIAPHPYYPGKQSLNSRLAYHRQLFHAAEYCHFYFRGVNPNRRLLRNAQKWGLPLVGSSDTHYLSQLGITYSLVSSEKTVPAVIDAIKKGNVEIITRPLTIKEALVTLKKVFVHQGIHGFLRWVG